MEASTNLQGDSTSPDIPPPTISTSAVESLTAEDLPAKSNKRRNPGTSLRGVANLTPERLEKKRANDREAQRAIRARTRHQIENLERRIIELTSQQPYQELQYHLRQKEAVQAENAEIRRRLSSALAILQPLLGSHKFNEFTPPHPPAQVGPYHPSIAGIQGYPSPADNDAPIVQSSQAPAACEPQRDALGSAGSTLDGMGPAPSWRTAAVPAPVGPSKTWSPVHSVGSQRESLGRGIDVGTSRERLGWDFLLDHRQRLPSFGNEPLPPAGPHSDAAGQPIPFDPQRVEPRSRASVSTPTPQLGLDPATVDSDGIFQAYTAAPRNCAATCPLDSILLDFIAERRQQIADGVPEKSVVGPPIPNFASLLHPERSLYSHPLSKVLTDILSRFPALSALPEKIAVLCGMFYFLQWQVSSTKERYDRLPEWLVPWPSQILVPHPVWIDYLPWPRMRDKLVYHYHEYPFEDFFAPFTTTLSINWPYNPADTLMTKPESEELVLSPLFNRHFQNLHNWSLGPAFAAALPGLAETARIEGGTERPFMSQRSQDTAHAQVLSSHPRG